MANKEINAAKIAGSNIKIPVFVRTIAIPIPISGAINVLKGMFNYA